VPEQVSLSKPARKLVRLFEGLSSSNRKVLLQLAGKLGKL
jgi:hypothetical protein